MKTEHALIKLDVARVDFNDDVAVLEYFAGVDHGDVKQCGQHFRLHFAIDRQRMNSAQPRPCSQLVDYILIELVDQEAEFESS